MTSSTTLFDKLWTQHRVASLPSGEDLIAIDRTFLHERTGSVALRSLEADNRPVKFPDRVFCTMDHIVSNTDDRGQDSARMPGGEIFISETRAASKAAGINLIDVLDPNQGIVHVVAPEEGIALPGLSIVCPDSHTCTLGGLGALAWGIGSSDAEHAMATGCLRVKKPPQMRITITGKLNDGVTAKDIALHIIGKLGASGAKRCAVEYAGDTIEALSIEARLTLCNLAVEYSAFNAIIAPDAKTIDFVQGRTFAPKGEYWEAAVAHWETLRTDDKAQFDFEYQFRAEDIQPTLTWGTSPEQALPVSGTIPTAKTKDHERALAYMDLQPGQALRDLKIGGAFIGSCTNARLSDLRAAAKILKGRHVAKHIEAICVPGSGSVKRAAEAEGLHHIFKAAGFEWGAPGCALCFYAGGKTFTPGTRVVSSTNRNFEGRQGPGVRTHLASPAIVAASAILGRIGSPDEVETI